MVELVATREVVAAKLDLSGRQVVVALAYLAPEDSVDSHMGLLQEFVTKLVDLDIIILGDFNAKSSVGSNPLHKTDVRGDIVEFCVQHDLVNMNDASIKAAF